MGRDKLELDFLKPSLFSKLMFNYQIAKFPKVTHFEIIYQYSVSGFPYLENHPACVIHDF